MDFTTLIGVIAFAKFCLGTATKIEDYFVYGAVTTFWAWLSDFSGLYRDEKVWKDFIDNDVKIYNNKTFYMEPLDQCTIKYYGNGKVVALERVDLYNRNEPGIIMNYTDNNDKWIESCQVLLFRPSKNAPLEQIR